VVGKLGKRMRRRRSLTQRGQPKVSPRWISVQMTARSRLRLFRSARGDRDVGLTMALPVSRRTLASSHWEGPLQQDPAPVEP
jgi:hypothetical protein